MTSYERASLFMSLVDSTAGVMMDFVSVLFGFLVAGYLVAPHINRVMSGIVIGLFGVFSVFMIFTANRNLETLASLADEMRSSAAAGNTALAWHPVIAEATNMPALALPVMMGLLIIASISGIIFYIYASRREPTSLLPSLP